MVKQHVVQEKIGVVLFQLGGPDSVDAIEPFLYNLFCDPDIINFPLARLGRKPLARLISSRRARHVAHHYEAIGGKSPILENTQRQARALERELRAGGMEAKVVVAMRYWRPFTADAVAEIKAWKPGQIVLLPLYPQYSLTTTGSSYREWLRVYGSNGTPARLIREFHEDEAYLHAVVASVNAALKQFDDPFEVDMVFSAHSIPVERVDAGDPYQQQIERTVDLVWRMGDWRGRRWLCYQSKVGPSRWLRPMMRETLEDLGKRGAQNVLMIPISFVSDHVETLFEIDIEHREIAQRAGIREFRMVPGLNDSTLFIQALAGMVRAQVSKALTSAW